MMTAGPKLKKRCRSGCTVRLPAATR